MPGLADNMARVTVHHKLYEKRKCEAPLRVMTTEELRQSFKRVTHYVETKGNLLVKTLDKCGNPECQNVHYITPINCDRLCCDQLPVIKCLTVAKHKHKENTTRDEKGKSPPAYASFCIVSKLKLFWTCHVLQSHVDHLNRHMQHVKFLLSYGSYSPNLGSEVAKCLKIALTNGQKTAFIENILYTYCDSIKLAMESVSEQSSTLNLFYTHYYFLMYRFELDSSIYKDVLVANNQDLGPSKLAQRIHQSAAGHPLLLDTFKSWPYCMLSYIFDCLKHDEKIVDNASVNTDVRDDEGNTPLHFVCKCSAALIAEVYSCHQDELNLKHELPIHIACKRKDLKLIKLVSSHLGEEINTQDIQGNTPLHIACKLLLECDHYCSLLECLNYFIHEKKCDINIQNNMGELPLHTFFNSVSSWEYYAFDDMNEVIELITSQQHYNINAQDSTGNTPLHIACKIGNSSTVLYLVSNFKCDLNITNNEECLPLHYALSSNLSLEAVKAVINGSTLKCKQNIAGKTPLHIACENISHQWMGNMKNVLLDLICDEESINVQDNEGNTPLHIACLKGDQETATYLLTSKFQCDIHLLNGNDCLPLHYAVSSSCSLLLVKIVSECSFNFLHVQNSSGMTPLHVACKNGDLAMMKYFVFQKKCSPISSTDIYDTLEIHSACEDGNDIDLLKALANERNVSINRMRYPNGGTPLHIACKNRNLLAVKMLLELSYDVMSLKDLKGRLPFHIACSTSLECVKMLSLYTTKELVNTFVDENRNMSLHIAIRNNCLDVVKFLLSKFQCDITVKNYVGELPMHMACRTTLHIVKIVMERSTTQGISVNIQNQHGNTPLHIACKHGALDIVKYLTDSFDCKPSMRLRNHKYKLPVDYACEHSLGMVRLVSQLCTVKDLVFQKFVPEESSHRYKIPTTLDIACQSGSLNVVKFLINEKCCALSALNNNHSALGYACGLLPHGFDSTPRQEIVQFLINECGNNPGITFHGISVFHHFCRINSLPLMKVLPVHIKDKDGNTPLHFACKYICTVIVKYLVDCGCNQNIINSKGETALHIACRSSLEVTKLLTNCDVNVKNADGYSPLHIACESKKEDIAKHLIEEMKCDVKIKNDHGEYALHKACINSLQIESLVQRSDTNCQDDYGNTPLHNACFIRDIDMIQFLLSHQECRADILNEDGDLALHVFLNEGLFKKYQGKSSCNDPQKTSLANVVRYCPPTTFIKNFLQVVELILQRYDAAAITINHNGLMPIDVAIIGGKLKLLQVLLNSSKVDVTKMRLLHKACANGRSEIVRWFIDNGASAEVTNDDNDLPQHVCFKSHFCLQTLTLLGPVDICKQGQNNDTILHLACRRSDDVLGYILQTLDNCDKAFSIQNINKDTPLHLLAAKRNVSSDTLVLIECDNPNLQDMSGNTPLHLACQHGNYKLAEHLITNCKCDPNVANDNGELPLHVAVAQSQVKITKLLASPENVNRCTKNGDSPLHVACRTVDRAGVSYFRRYQKSFSRIHGIIEPQMYTEASLEIVKLMTTSVNANIQNANGDTPLHIACRGENLDKVLYLLKEINCSVELLNKYSESAFHILFNNYSLNYSDRQLQKSVIMYIPKSLKDVSNKIGDTLLHIACRKADQEVIMYLVEVLGCNINIVNEFSGATALHFACSRDLLTVVKLVSGYNQTAQITDVSYFPREMEFVSGDTPLHVACRKGNINVIRYLLQLGHSQALNYSNDLNELPVHLAVAANQSIQLINVFIQYKECFDCNAKNELNGDTPLHIMCRHEPSVSSLQLVVHELKCRIDVQNNEGNLPLHIACQNKHVKKDVVKVLCEALNDGMIKHLNKNGNTALNEFLLCQHDMYNTKHFQSVLKCFVDRGLLQLETTKEQILKYLHLACRRQKVDVVKYLCEISTSQLPVIPVSLLHEACLNHNKNVLKYILTTFKQVFDVNIPNENGDLPLHLASRMKLCVQSTILLIKMTRDVNHRNNQRDTPLHVLYSGDKTFKSQIVLLEFLKTEAVDFLAMNTEGFTPLHYMCKANQFHDLKIVLKRKEIGTNIQDKNGRTLLHLACLANNFETVKFLLESTKADASVEDCQQLVPVSLTTDPRIIKLLIKSGADPQPLYTMHKEFFERFSCENPPPTPVKLLVIGYPSVGKTTLIQSLQNELSEEVITENFDHTAGIVTTNFSSQHYGVVTFYDFAGQAEYYASHDAVLHSTIKNVPPVVLILVKLNEPKNRLIKQTNYWINFMANRCSGLGSEAAHMILVGSHADVLESKGRNPSEKVSKLHQSVAAQVEKKNNIILKGVVHLNCTKPKSIEMSKLQELLQQSTNEFREKGVMDFNSHCFYVFLLHMFRNSNVVTLGHILSALKSKSKDIKNSPLFALPSDSAKIIEMCHDLNEKGHIMFIENPTMSWLILDKAPLLQKCLGTLFSPTNFPQHCPLSYSTGVIPLSRFDNHFSTKHSYPSTLLLAFLNRLEYCREIKDPIVLECIIKEKEFSKSERYFFFPNLVSLKRPTDKWNNTKFSYHSGWMIKCNKDGECFSSHFIQAILLRLAFSFTPRMETDEFKAFNDSSDSEEDDESQIENFKGLIKRQCSVWKNGIYWMEATGVKTVVECINHNALVLLMQCLKGCELELVERRSSIISMVLSAKDEYCSKAELREYFLDPVIVTHPLPKLKHIQRCLFPFHQVLKSITEKNPCVINDQDNHVKLKDLLYFEPFSELSKNVKKVKYRHILYKEKFSIFFGRTPPRGI